MRLVASVICLAVLAGGAPAVFVDGGSVAAASGPAGANRAPVLTNPGAQANGDSSGSYAEAVLSDAPVGYWRLGETTGTGAADNAGTNPGTGFGGVTLGQSGALADGNPAMQFDGSTGYVRVANSAAVQLAGDLTIELWLNVSMATRQTLISKDYLREFELTVETSGHLSLYQGNGTTSEGVASVQGAVNANTWQHVVVTRATATKTIRFYVNGIAKGSGTYVTTPTSGPKAVVFGRSDNYPGVRYVNGRLDEVALYPAALSAAQVATHYGLRASSGTGTPIALQLAASDPDGDALTYSATGFPSSLTLDPATGLISGTLSATSAGTYQVTVTGSDGSLSNSQTFTWTVTHTNRGPVLANPGNQTSVDNYSYGQAVLADRPAAYWRLAEAIGPAVADSAGPNPGTAFGGVTLGQPGALGDGNSAVLLNGSTGYLRVSSPAVPLTGDLTIEMWANVSLAARQTLISKDYLHEFELTVETSGHLSFYQGNGTTNESVSSISGAVAANTWQHVVVTRTAATRTIRFYVNDLAKGSGTYVTTPTSSAKTVVIGRSDNYPGVRYVNGRLDEVALYHAALSPAQIATHYLMRAADGTGSPAALQLMANDADGDSLTYSAIGLPVPLVVNSATGLIAGTLSSASAGPYLVRVTVSDRSLSNTQTFTWMIGHVNRAPTLTGPGNQTSAENTIVSLPLGSSDPEGTALTYSATGLPASLTLNPATGLISGTLSFTSAGTYLVTATASDGSLSSSQPFTWTVTNTNRATVLANPGNQANTDNRSYVESVLADVAAAHWRLDEATGTNVADGAGANPGTVLGGVTRGQPGALGDGNPALLFNGSTGYIRVAHQAAPSLAGDLTIEMWVNVSLAARQTLISKSYLSEFELTLETSGHLSFYQGNGTVSEFVTSVSGAVTSNAWQHVVVTRTTATKTIRFYVNGIPKGSASYLTTPTSGTNAVVIGRSDNYPGVRYVNGRLDEVALYRTALSPAQIATRYALRTYDGTSTPITLQLMANDSDGDALTYTAIGLPPPLTVNAATGLISGTLSQASAGVYQVTATASDGSLSNSQTFTWTVTHINRAPTLASPGNQTSAENTSISLPVVASDPDGTPLTYSMSGLPASLTLNPATGLISGTLSFTSAGTYLVTATVSDGSLAQSQTFTWTVTNMNGPPVLANPGPQSNADTPSYAQTVRADTPAAYWRLGDTTGTSVADSAGTNPGTRLGGVILGQPGALDDGNMAMRFDGIDGTSLSIPNTPALAAINASSAITMEAWINPQTVALPSHFRIFFSFPGNPSSYLGIYDGDGSPKVIVALNINGVQRFFALGPTLSAGEWYHAVATYDGARLTLYVNGSLAGQVTGLAGSIAIGTGGVTLGGHPTAGHTYNFNGLVDDAALYRYALSAAQIATHYARRTSTAAVALQLRASDPDGDTLTHSAIGLPTALTINAATGLISGTLTQTSAGTYLVTATVSDGSLSTSQTFTWTITHINRPPTMTSPGNQTSAEDTNVSLQVAASDPDGEALTYSATGLPISVTLDATTGLISGTLSFTSAGTYLVTVTASDGLLSASQFLTWTVTNTNRAPLLVNPGAQTNGDNSAYAQTVLSDAPVAYWRLGETTFGTAADSAGTNPAARFGGITLGEPGALAAGNPAMRFDGSTGYLRVANAPALQLAGDLTIEMWINLSLSTRQTLISKDFLHEFELTVETSGHLSFYQGNGTTYEGVASVSGAVSANTWQLVVVTRRGATKTISFYVNGIAKGGGTYVNTPTSGSKGVVIGRSDNYPGVRYVTGRLDEVALYPAALSAVQIAAHYAQRPSAGTAVALQLTASDADGEVLTYSAVGLPSTLVVNAATGLISGTLSPSSAGTYMVTVTASDGSLSQSQAFTWTITNTTDYDLSLPLTWTTVPGAQAYRVYAGTTLGGSDLADSGELHQTSYDASSVADSIPPTSVVWDFDDTLLDVQGHAVRLDGERTDFGALLPAGCASAAGVATCYLVDLPPLTSGSHAIEVSAYNWTGETVAAPVSVSESDHTVYVRLWTKIAGVWAYSDTRFMRSPFAAKLVYPVPGAIRADITKAIRWTFIPGADAYSLSIGRSPGTADLLNLPELHATSYLAPTLPGDQPLYARLGTRVRGVWRYSEAMFVASPAVAYLAYPQDGTTLTATSATFWWSFVPGAAAYRLDVGTTPGANDVVRSGEQPETFGLMTNLPVPQTLYARLWTKLNGIWRYTDSVFTTRAAVLSLARFVSPLNGAVVSERTTVFQWTPVPQALGYHLSLGSTPGAEDFGQSPDYITAAEYISGLPPGRIVHVRLYTKYGYADLDHYVDIAITVRAWEGDPGVPGIGVDRVVSSDGAGTRTTPLFSTAASGEVLIAFASSDGPGNNAQTLTVSGAGLSWTLVARANTQAGTAEIWTATAPAPLSNVAVSSTPSSGGYRQALTVVAFTGAIGTGASAIADGPSGDQSVSLVTTRPGSVVYGVGQDWDHAIARTMGADQTMLHQWVDTTTGDTYWVQAVTGAVATTATTVRLNDTAPINDRWNFASVEIIRD